MLRTVTPPILGTLALLLLSAPPAQAQSPAGRDALRAALSGGAPSAPAASSGAARASRGAPAQAGALNTLTQASARPLSAIEPTAVTPLTKGASPVMLHVRCGDHLLVSNIAKGRQGISHQSVFALQLSTGRATPAPNTALWYASCVGDDIAVGMSSGPAVFRAAHARWESSKLSVPGQDKLQELVLVPITGADGQASGDFLVRATSATAKLAPFYYGLWRPGDETLHLNKQDFHYASAASYAGDKLRVVANMNRSADGEQGPPALFELSASGVKLLQHGEARLMAGGWAIVTRDASQLLVAPDGSVQRFDTSQCKPYRQQVFTSSRWASALVRCVDAQDNSRDHFIAWSPARTLRWSLTRDYAEGVRDERPLYDGSPISSTWERDARLETRRWFDLRSGVAWQSEDLIPLDSWDTISEGRILASDTPTREGAGQKQRIALSLVDLNTGGIHALHQYDDCPGFLMVAAQRHDQAIVQCMLKPTPGKWDFFAQWSEVINLDSGQRWRAPKGHDLLSLLGEHEVLMADRGPRQSQLHVSPRKLWKVQLPWGPRVATSHGMTQPLAAPPVAAPYLTAPHDDAHHVADDAALRSLPAITTF